MPTYKLRASNEKTSHVEYEESLWGTDALKTLMVLTEAILPYEDLTGTLLLGMELTEGTSEETGDILWFTDSQIGLGNLSDEWTGELAVTGEEVTLTGGEVQNLLERTADTPIYQTIDEVIESNLGYTTDDETVYLDVQNIKKILVTNMSAGYLRLFNESSSYPLSGWIGPQKTLMFNVNHRIRKLLVRLSQAELAYSIAAEGTKIPEITLLARALPPRPPQSNVMSPPVLEPLVDRALLKEEEQNPFFVDEPPVQAKEPEKDTPTKKRTGTSRKRRNPLKRTKPKEK